MSIRTKTPEDVCKELGLDYDEKQTAFVLELTKQIASQIYAADEIVVPVQVKSIIALRLINYMKGKPYEYSEQH